MNILINASNLSGGGGSQVCNSICRYLKDYPQHSFVVVLSKYLDNTVDAIKDYTNVKIIRYSCSAGDVKSFITFRNSILDNIVSKYSINCVFTIFGPIKWRPRCFHICGFGLSHIVMPESPFFQCMGFKDRLLWKKTIAIWKYIFYRSADIFITENQIITERLQLQFKDKKVLTISNNYNQVFDEPERWIEYRLPNFNGVQLLDIAAYGPHKNEVIALEIAHILKAKYPNFKCRFIFTFNKEKYPDIPKDIVDYFYFTGPIRIEECPSLYQQCDIEFQPTLLECFTATYPEGMRMDKPIITTDLEFARCLCADAALYYEPLSAEAAANAIYRLANDEELQIKLVLAGRKQLDKFDSSKRRIDKIISLCENIKDNL